MEMLQEKELLASLPLEKPAELVLQKNLRLHSSGSLDFIGLPLDVCFIILSFLDFRDICRLQSTCSSLYLVCGNDQTWKCLVLIQNWAADFNLECKETTNWKAVFK